MADQTHGAVDSLLGLLSTAIKDEARLLGGVQGDIQFIKDEMDSMNGFLLHLNKTETEHNDQHRAWMKQVRDIAYIAQDCIELYVRDLTPPGRTGLWASLRHLPVLLRTMPARHRLATRIRELKVRVRDVGERRLRYGVTVPEDKKAPHKRSKPAAGQDDKDIKRKAFLRTLDDVPETPPPASFGTAIDLLLLHTASASQGDVKSLKTTISSILERSDVHTGKLLLRALHAYPHGTKQELDKLDAKLKEEDGGEAAEEVMIFCYSKLSTNYKSCLQYLTTFLVESSISRTNLMRRWLAEGMVAKEDNKTLGEAAELCFSELVFRGFVCPVEFGATGKVKSCKMDEHVQGFIVDIANSENFVAGMPTHLGRQLHIRKIVQQQRQRQEQPRQEPRPWNIRNLCAGSAPRDDYTAGGGGGGVAADKKNLPLDELVRLLRSLPEEYRLNVLDLGGCNGLKKRHLKSICKVLSLKYLTLRNTNVSRLPRQINNLRQLETLDVRQTDVRDDDTRRIFLPKLKHLLAGRRDDGASNVDAAGRKVASLSTVRLPLNVGGMTDLELLSHVRVSRRSSVLGQVGLLKNLRKLGVVLHGEDQAGVRNLLRVVGRLSNLRSLSVWIMHNDTRRQHEITTAGDGVNLEWERGEGGDATFTPPTLLESLNISGEVGSAGIPSWIVNLAVLSKVTLCETALPDRSLQTLGKLQGLRCLRLRGNAFHEAKLIFNAGEFSKLESLLIEDGTMSGIHFQPGAAPKLEKIVWWRNAGGADITSDMVSGTLQLPLPAVELNRRRCNCSLQPLEQGVAAHAPDGIAEGLARDITIAEAVDAS